MHNIPSWLGNNIYEPSYNGSFHQKMDSIKYSFALDITGAGRGTSRERTLTRTRRFKKVCVENTSASKKYLKENSGLSF